MTTLLTDIINNMQLADEALDILIEDFISDHNYYFGTTATSGIDELYIAYATTASGWRAEGFRDAWNQYYRSKGYIVFSDNVNTPLYKADMLAYSNLIDGNSNSSVSFTYATPSGSWLDIEYPVERTTNLIKVNIAESNVNACFAYSTDNSVWTYLGATPSNHELLALTDYATLASGIEAYCTLSGSNTFTTTDNFRMRYFKMYFTSASGSYDATVSLFSCGQQTYIEDLAAGTIDTSKLVISSPDGRTTFDGNTLKIIDSIGNIRVELGLLV